MKTSHRNRGPSQLLRPHRNTPRFRKQHVKDWDPGLYLQFGDQRALPSVDLVARIPSERPNRIVDLGCGTGNSTSLLRARWPEAEIVGVDSSSAMIDAARDGDASVEWVVARMEDWDPGEAFDLVFSNAALQWVSGHHELFPKLMGLLGAAGHFAAQMPQHYASPLHQVMVDVSMNPRWANELGPARDALEFHGSGFYYDLLAGLTDEISIWETEYFHVMASPAAILEWISATGMRPFVEALHPEYREPFRLEVLKGYERNYTRRFDGKVLFPFRR